MPPKNKSNTEDIIDALLDPKVIEALGKALGATISTIVEQSIDSKFATLMGTVKGLTERVSKLESSVKKLDDDNRELHSQINRMEGYTRGENLILHGLKESCFAEAASASALGQGSQDGVMLSSGSMGESVGPTETSEHVERAVIQFCSTALNVHLTRSDISVAHRLKKKNLPGRPDQPAPIIVRFANRRSRNAVYAARKTLRQSCPGAYVNEHLTQENAALFRTARQLIKSKKIQRAWTTNGNVFIKISDMPGTVPIRVNDMKDLPQG
jgi:hypothetical protein